ncbi:MAG: diguanylate cyclase, partial [Gammaproteobacteria bacterium]
MLVAILPAVCLAVLLSFYFITQRSHDVERSLHHEIANLAAYIANNSEFDLLTGNLDTLQKTITRISQENDLIFIKIQDKDQKVVASIDKRLNQSNTLPKSATLARHLFEVAKTITITPIAVNDYRFSKPDNRNNQPQIIGKVIIGATDIYASRMKQQLEIQALIIIGIAISLTIIFAIFLAQSVSKPLTLLSRGIEKIKAGNLQHRIAEQSGGEIGVLEKNVNEMAISLANAQAFERRQAANILHSERIKAHTTLESIGEGVITTNENAIITYINPAASKLTGYRYGESIGQPLDRIFRTYSDSQNDRFTYPIDSCLSHGHVVRHDAMLKLICKNGEEFIIRDTATPIRDHDNRIVGAVVIFDDFSTMHAMGEKLVYQASHDDLTGLYNRREFENQLDVAINETRQHHSDNSVFFIDLDQFKVVNDSCGHAAGDQLLKQISQLFRTQIREHDILARLGGDEFGIILRDCHRVNAVELAHDLLDVMQTFVFSWGNQQFNVGACIGMVTLSPKFINTSDVLMAADSACYLAKEGGRNNLHIYEESDREQQKRRSETKWVQRLKTALAEDSFTLYAQKIHPLNESTQTANYEILLRLNLDGNIYAPGTFMSAAERYNLMPEIDRWVINTLFSRLENFIASQDNAKPIRFNINLSGQSLTRDDFHEFVYNTVMASKIDHTLITFEITETATIANMARAIDFMKKLKTMGCQFALDDFGSVLSSFGYLTSLPLDYIKIDG